MSGFNYLRTSTYRCKFKLGLVYMQHLHWQRCLTENHFVLMVGSHTETDKALTSPSAFREAAGFLPSRHFALGAGIPRCFCATLSSYAKPDSPPCTARGTCQPSTIISQHGVQVGDSSREMPQSAPAAAYTAPSARKGAHKCFHLCPNSGHHTLHLS